MNFEYIDTKNKLDKLNINFNNYNIKINIKTNVESVLFKFLSSINGDKSYYINNNKIKYIDITNNEESYLFFIKCIDISNDLIKKNNLLNTFDDNIWNVCIYNDMMFNLPFTLENIIFLPINFIETCKNNNEENKFIETLIHEKIHVLQRKNNDFWDNYINKFDSKWIKITKDNLLFNNIKNSINNFNEKIVIYNPDTYYDFLYIYKKNDKIYLGLLVLKNKNLIETKWFEYNTAFNKLIILDYNLFDEEHPYELLAYKLSYEIVKNI
jgi:hypothetical protein